MTHIMSTPKGGMARCSCGVGPGPTASIADHVTHSIMVRALHSPLVPLVTILRAQAPSHPYERHAWVGDPHAGQASLCGGVQYTRTLHDGLVPWCNLCRAAGLGALALTASALGIFGADRLTLGRPDPDPEHDRKKAVVDADWALLRGNGARR